MTEPWRLLRPAMSPARLTHGLVPWQESHKHKLISGLGEQNVQHRCVEKWLQACRRVSLIWENDAWCHRSNAMVSSGMHVKFPESFLKDFIFVTLVGMQKGGYGKAVQKDICEDWSWAAFRSWKIFKVKAFICKQQYINKLYTIFTNAFSCIKTNRILFTVPLFIQVAIP